MRYVSWIVLCVLFWFIPITAFAGSLDSPAAPTDSASAMYTVEDIYNRLDAGTEGTKRTGPFTEPSSGPTAGTGHTLDEVMGKAPSLDNTDGAGVADVLAGKTFWGLTSGAWGTTTGTMTNNGPGTTIPVSGCGRCGTDRHGCHAERLSNFHHPFVGWCSGGSRIGCNRRPG